MAWITVSQFKSDFSAASRATDSQVTMAIEAAEDELVELVGQEAVTDALEAAPADPERAAKLIRGHKFLAISIFLFNVRTIKREHDAGSPALTGRQVINEYYTPKELAELSERWRSLALKALASYLIVDAAGDEYAAGPEYSHPAEPDACSTDICCSSS